MFEAELKEKFKAIFAVKEVTFDEPGESEEQNVLWVQIDEPKFTFKDGEVKALVTGSASMFGRNDALTFGYFAKAIAKAPNALTKDLFFTDFETNSNRFRDKVQRGFSFTYFFHSQHDPAIGTITSVTPIIEET